MLFSHQKRIINPPLPVFMEGYTRRIATAIHDDIEAHILALKQGDHLLIWCLLDLILIEKSFGQRLRQSIASHAGIAEEQVMISATHTHSGPQTSGVLSDWNDVNKKYLDTIEQTLMSGAKEALAELTEVNLFYQEVNLGTFYSNRNCEDGYANALGYMLRFQNEAGIVLLDFLNLNCHPTILKEDTLSISSDLIGSVRHHFQNQTGHGLVIALGEAGDVSTRFKRQGTDFQEVNRVGEGIARCLCQNHWQPVEITKLEMKTINYQQPYKVDEDLWLQEAYKQMKTLISHDKQYELIVKFLEKRLSLNSELLEYQGFICHLGNLNLVFFPGEIVSLLGKVIRNSSSDKLILAAYSNEFLGYAVDQENYGRFGESFLTEFPLGVADAFVNHICHRLKEK